jgi:hypothetical protein
MQDLLLKQLKAQYPSLTKLAERSPLRAIRLFCLQCMGGNSTEVGRCAVTNCPLYIFRYGKGVNDKNNQGVNNA